MARPQWNTRAVCVHAARLLRDAASTDAAAAHTPHSMVAPEPPRKAHAHLFPCTCLSRTRAFSCALARSNTADRKHIALQTCRRCAARHLEPSTPPAPTSTTALRTRTTRPLGIVLQEPRAGRAVLPAMYSSHAPVPCGTLLLVVRLQRVHRAAHSRGSARIRWHPWFGSDRMVSLHV